MRNGREKPAKYKYVPLCDVKIVHNIKQLNVILKQNKLKNYVLQDIELGEKILLNSIMFN